MRSFFATAGRQVASATPARMSLKLAGLIGVQRPSAAVKGTIAAAALNERRDNDPLGATDAKGWAEARVGCVDDDPVVGPALGPNPARRRHAGRRHWRSLDGSGDPVPRRGASRNARSSPRCATAAPGRRPASRSPCRSQARGGAASPPDAAALPPRRRATSPADRRRSARPCHAGKKARDPPTGSGRVASARSRAAGPGSRMPVSERQGESRRALLRRHQGRRLRRPVMIAVLPQPPRDTGEVRDRGQIRHVQLDRRDGNAPLRQRMQVGALLGLDSAARESPPSQ